MSMCFGCAAKFGIFKREHGCRNCGKAFCSGCLSYKAIVKSSSKEQSVCKNCFKSLTSAKEKKIVRQNAVQQSSKQERVNLPEEPPTYLGPSIRNLTNSKAQTQPDPEAEIRKRLAKLKEKDCDQNTDENIAERFKELTGRPATCTQKNDILTPRPKLTEQEEIDRLMEQATAEANLGKDSDDEDKVEKNSNKDIENRLLLLKGIDPDSVKEKSHDQYSSDDEEETAADILKKVLAEAQLDDKVREEGFGDFIERKKEAGSEENCGINFPSIPSNSIGGPRIPQRKFEDDDDDGELPWCCICNADATLRCKGCDDDLYCRRCFKEGHSRSYMDMEEHTTSNYRPKRKK